MRTGPRIVLATVLASAALCSPALAADTLTAYVDNNSIALGSGTQIAAHAETDETYGGGHVAFKYKPADQDCRATPAEDEGTDASGEQPTPVPAGAGTKDVAGAPIQLDVGNWRICAWLLDDAAGTTVAQGSTVVQVIPYSGSIRIGVKRTSSLLQFVLTYATTAPAQLYAGVQSAAKQCSRSAGQLAKGSVLLTPRGGRFVGSDGGLGRSISLGQLGSGRWRVCAWLKGDYGAVGPASRTFSVRRRARHAGRVAG